MQTLYTVPDENTGGIKTELHVSSYTKYGLFVTIYSSDEWGNHKRTINRKFTNMIDLLYHKMLRAKIKKEGGIIHKRVSDTPLPKTIIPKSNYPNRDNKGRFIKVKRNGKNKKL